jgi:hypothetical protein
MSNQNKNKNNQKKNNNTNQQLLNNNNPQPKNNNTNQQQPSNNNQKKKNNNNQGEQNPYKRGCNQARRNLDKGCKFTTADRAAKYAKQTYVKKGDRKFFGLMLTDDAKQFVKGYSNKMAQGANNSSGSNNYGFWNTVDKQIGQTQATGGGRRCSAFTCEGKRCKRRTRLGIRCSSHC